MVEEIAAAYAALAEIDYLDGVSLSHEGETGFWRANVRASNTEPLLRLNVEGSSPAVMERVRDELLGLIRAGSATH